MHLMHFLQRRKGLLPWALQNSYWRLRTQIFLTLFPYLLRIFPSSVVNHLLIRLESTITVILIILSLLICTFINKHHCVSGYFNSLHKSKWNQVSYNRTKLFQTAD